MKKKQTADNMGGGSNKTKVDYVNKKENELGNFHNMSETGNRKSRKRYAAERVEKGLERRAGEDMLV